MMGAELSRRIPICLQRFYASTLLGLRLWDALNSVESGGSTLLHFRCVMRDS